jgi:hypothetical protein
MTEKVLTLGRLRGFAANGIADPAPYIEQARAA